MENFGEIGERVALPVQRIGALGDRDGFAGGLLGLGVVAAARDDQSLDLPPPQNRAVALFSWPQTAQSIATRA